jgi:hemerythrin
MALLSGNSGERLNSGGHALALIVLDDWLTNHILQTDKQYSDHLNASGIF